MRKYVYTFSLKWIIEGHRYPYFHPGENVLLESEYEEHACVVYVFIFIYFATR